MPLSIIVRHWEKNCQNCMRIKIEQFSEKEQTVIVAYRWRDGQKEMLQRALKTKVIQKQAIKARRIMKNKIKANKKTKKN